MANLSHYISVLILLVQHVFGNTEKIIFSAPAPVVLPDEAVLGTSSLISLNPDQPSVRMSLDVVFPSPSQPRGSESWVLLEGLHPLQRYEIRVCWLATQPTAFWLYSHQLTEVMDDAELLTSLETHSHRMQAAYGAVEKGQIQARRWHGAIESAATSSLLLQIYAAADYFSSNKTLMTAVPPVIVDIILDPYIFNILPRSLLSTAGYIIIVSILAWFLSAWISQHLHSLADSTKLNVGQRNSKDARKRE